MDSDLDPVNQSSSQSDRCYGPVIRLCPMSFQDAIAASPILHLQQQHTQMIYDDLIAKYDSPDSATGHSQGNEFATKVFNGLTALKGVYSIFHRSKFIQQSSGIRHFS